MIRAFGLGFAAVVGIFAGLIAVERGFALLERP